MSWLISMLSLASTEVEASGGDGSAWLALEWVAIVSIAFGLPMLARKGFASFRVGVLDINCLMVIAVIGAVALGDYEEGAAVTFLFSLSGIFFLIIHSIFYILLQPRNHFLTNYF